MRSNWAKYFDEKDGLSSIETEHGFLTFKKQDDTSFYIRDLYVDPDFRGKDAAKEMADAVCEIARTQNSKAVFGSVSEFDVNATKNISILIAYGMKFHGFNDKLRLLIFRKDL